MLLDRVIELGLETADKFPRRKRAPWPAQERTLRKLLKRARKTVFGRAYGFKGILTSKDCLTK